MKITADIEALRSAIKVGSGSTCFEPTTDFVANTLKALNDSGWYLIDSAGLIRIDRAAYNEGITQGYNDFGAEYESEDGEDR